MLHNNEGFGFNYLVIPLCPPPPPFSVHRCIYHLILLMTSGITNEVKMYRDVSECTEWKTPKAARIERCLGKRMKMECISPSHRELFHIRKSECQHNWSCNFKQEIRSSHKLNCPQRSCFHKSNLVFLFNAGGVHWKGESKDECVWPACPPCVIIPNTVSIPEDTDVKTPKLNLPRKQSERMVLSVFSALNFSAAFAHTEGNLGLHFPDNHLNFPFPFLYVDTVSILKVPAGI